MTLGPKQDKEPMEGYVGVKFDSTCISEEIPSEAMEYMREFRGLSKDLVDSGLTYKNAGNISLRIQGGFLITGSGVYLEDIAAEDLVKVLNYDLEDFFLTYVGMIPPSAESFLHGIVYEAREDIQCIIHAHDPLTSRFTPSRTKSTPEEYEYGTSDLARVCLEELKKGDIVFLKNHGFVAVGADLDRALETLSEAHRELVEQENASD